MAFTFYILSFIKDGDFKRYVGQTQHLEKRIKQHLAALSKGVHSNVNLQSLHNAGWKFTGIPFYMEFEDRETAYAMEQLYISENRDNSEIVNIECGNDTFTYHPSKEERREKLRCITKAWRVSLSEKEKASYALKHTGENNWMFGKTHSPETRRLIREKLSAHYKNNVSANKGKPKSAEQRKALSAIASKRLGNLNPFFGKSHTETTKQKLAEMNKGKLPPNTKKVSINGVVYESMTEAGRQLKINTSVVFFRVKSENPKFSEWKWF